MAIVKSWCLIPVVIFFQLFTSTWVFADDAGFNATSSDSLNESTSLVGPSNESGFNNQEQQQPALPQSGLDQNFDFSQFNNFNSQQQPADQPQQEPHEVVMPTRPPNDPNRASTFPPLVHNDQHNGTGKDATTMKPAGTGEKSKGGNNGSAGFYASVLVVLCGASVLHLLN